MTQNNVIRNVPNVFEDLSEFQAEFLFSNVWQLAFSSVESASVVGILRFFRSAVIRQCSYAQVNSPENGKLCFRYLGHSGLLQYLPYVLPKMHWD